MADWEKVLDQSLTKFNVEKKLKGVKTKRIEVHHYHHYSGKSNLPTLNGSSGLTALNGTGGNVRKSNNLMAFHGEDAFKDDNRNMVPDSMEKKKSGFGRVLRTLTGE